jgi:hypothetical protein
VTEQTAEAATADPPAGADLPTTDDGHRRTDDRAPAGDDRRPQPDAIRAP